MMMNCFCGMVDQLEALSLISSRGPCQRSSPLRISETPQAGFEPAQNLSSGFIEWSCAVVITTTPRHYGATLNDFAKLENLRHLFLTSLYFKGMVICEYSIDFHETFTVGLKLIEV